MATKGSPGIGPVLGLVAGEEPNSADYVGGVFSNASALPIVPTSPLKLSVKPLGLSHNERGTNYGREAVNIYGSTDQWSYIEYFLKPYFLPDLKNLDGQKVLDAGCGVGLWSIVAARNGGQVFGIDLQPGMITQAKTSSLIHGVAVRTEFVEGDVGKLPCEDATFDKALSINVACNLPDDALFAHLSEFFRVLKPGGEAIVTIPISLHALHTTGARDEMSVHRGIQQLLETLYDNPTPEEILSTLASLEDVLSATFTIENDRLVLVTELDQLEEGQEIWRKLPNMTLPNRYYSERRYQMAIEDSGLSIVNEERPVFSSEMEMEQFNEGKPAHLRMGPEYLSHPPFVIYHLKKHD